MYCLNKLLWMLFSPSAIGVVMLAVGLILVWRKRSRLGWWAVCVALAYFAIISMPISAYWLGKAIEGRYSEIPANEMPCADIVLDFGNYYERSWYAAELVKAGKATALVASGAGITNQNVRLIRDLGVPEDKLIVENEARNTEENVKLSKALVMRDERFKGLSNVRVLVVSSAAHMPRCMLMMARHWPEAEAIPAPCNFMSNEIYSHGFHIGLLRPMVSSLADFESFYHEVVGWLYYRCLN